MPTNPTTPRTSADTRTVPNLETLLSLDENEVVEGYLDGFRGEPEPGNNRSLAYWHGWRNGAVDKGLRKSDSEQQFLVHAYVKHLRESRA